MTTHTALDLEAIAHAVATDAAALVRDVVGHGTVVRTKSSATDVVTTTDLRSEQLIRRALEQRVPNSAVIGEEYPASEGSSDVSWIVDPIDGTVNFLYDLPVVAVSVAAQVGDTVVAGAVADVLRGEVFSAALHGGARRDGVTITASDVDQLDHALVATGYSYASSTRAQQAHTLAELLPQVRDIRSMGSAALQLCWVGCGRIDGYYERDLKPWDYAAGALIAAESGATVTTPQAAGADLTTAATPGVHDELMRIVGSAG
ncbi:MAG: inositol monophosphatase family protein [Actinomycetota bacterium]